MNRFNPNRRFSASTLALVLFGATRLAFAADSLTVTPSEVTLRWPTARQRLVVTGEAQGRQVDLTDQVRFESADPAIVRVDSTGVLTPVADGTTEVTVEFADRKTSTKVHIRDAAARQPISFERDIQPILTRQACNSGPCHGKARGQNGFQLSLLAFDHEFDFASIAKESRGRRVFPAAAEQSLLLRKASAQIPHGGGKRLDAKAGEYDLLRRWIVDGMPRRVAEEPALERVDVFPTERSMATGERQQLLVTARYSDGSQRDVTHLTTFQSSENVTAEVDENGLIAGGPVTGEAAIMARYMSAIATAHIAIPLPGEVAADLFAALPRRNFIDGLVWSKLQRLGITPSGPCGDATYLRRVSIDIIGRLPTPAEARAFLADEAPDKRAKLVDRLLERPEYADHWANKWVDLLRPNPYRVGIKAVFNLDAWIRDAFRRNMPYDEFVRRIIAAQGSTFAASPATIFRDRRSPEEVATMMSQLFLGVRLECARCHHHPFEIWAQEDFFGFAGYFAQVGRKGTGLSPPISGSEEIVFAGSSGSIKHPLSGKVVAPKPLFGSAPEVGAEQDLRVALAEWITSDQNHFFSQVIANRVWADLMGRGIVEPVDDIRGTNPASNQELLEGLGHEFRSSMGCDLKQLIRAIANSHVYGLSSEPTERNRVDGRNYSRHYRQRLRAEVLLDAISDVTGVPESFVGMPAGSRAAQIWTHRASSLFLDTFGRPDPNQDPPCERTPETTVVQSLHLMNSPQLHKKITAPKGRAAQLAEGDLSNDAVIDELYLLAYSRFPTDEEKQVGRELFAEAPSNRRPVVEDLMWALINTPEFVFKD